MVCYTVTNAKKKNKAKNVLNGIRGGILYGWPQKIQSFELCPEKKRKAPAVWTSRGRALHAEWKWKQEHMVWGKGPVGDE